MIALLTFHLAAAISAPTLVRLWGRNAFFVLAAAPAAAVVYALTLTRQAFTDPYVQDVSWIPTLDLSLAFRVDVLSWLMMLIVGGVGMLVMVYSARYFGPRTHGLGRFAGVFVGFAGAMLGVVTSDQTMGLYFFWEMTSILSFLLIGHHHDRAPARAAARQAILLTSSGALAMFAGLVMLGQVRGGSFRVSELVASLQVGDLDPHLPLVVVAALLIILGAATKSALFPYYFWLPGAMAAPTPVSAYLHAAAMVKAGVYLVARLTPGFTEIPLWSPIIVGFGFVTMLIGSYRALRQYDLKLILAYGTVSQLGLMTAAVGMGSAGAMAAGLALLIAHSLFKAALFLTVGAVEFATGTRDLRELTGLWRGQPRLAAAAALATLSMAGFPLTAGYLGKEGLITTLVEAPAAPWAGLGISWGLLALLVAGSMLTMAYAWRFWWGAFATKRLDIPRTVRPTPAGMSVPIFILSLGALLGLFPRAVSRVVSPPAASLPGTAHIALWSGLVPALLTALIIGGAVLLAVKRPLVARLQRRVAPRGSLVQAYSWSIAELELVASRTTSLLHHGSLRYDLSIIFATLVVLVSVALSDVQLTLGKLRLWDSYLQASLVALAIVAAIVTVRARRRIKAALSLAGVGMMATLIFAAQGAPDLALTQLVVEAVSIVVFILVLRKLPLYFSDRPLASSRWVRLVIAASVGLIVIIGGWVATSARMHETVSNLMPREAFRFGHGENIVNVILVDIRAWDTVGELSVLLVTATGVASLIYLQSRTGKIDRPPPSLREDASLLPGAVALQSRDRTIVLEVSTRLLFPTMIVLSIWLLFVGHNLPGGGFAGGVVAGLAFVLRYLAGGRYELGEAMPIPAGRLLGLGLFTAAAGGAAPLLFGNDVLQSTAVTVGLGFLGEIHFTTAMILDVGVYILVVGVVIDLVAALGPQIDRQNEHDRAAKTARRARARTERRRRHPAGAWAPPSPPTGQESATPRPRSGDGGSDRAKGT